MTTSPLKMTKKILIIGSGFSSISAATYLADKGYDVTVFEKTLHLVEGLENLKLMDSLLIWDHHGIGCQMFLRNILMTLVNLLVTL